MTPAPEVSVIIPTYRRPDLVLTAVRSVLTQTFSNLEVIVVVDGRDDDTVQVLGTEPDPRLRVIVPPEHLGNAEARNAGVSQARAALVAFLDDDDTWLPRKLEYQVPLARSSSRLHPVITCRVLVHAGQHRAVWPRRFPRDGEDWSEYFFCRRTPFTGEGMITMTSVLTTTALLRAEPFRRDLARHVDTDWTLRVARRPDVDVRFADPGEPLVVWQMEHDRARITTRRDWRESHAWARGNRHLFSPRGYAAFLLHVVGFNAAAQHAWSAFPALLGEAFRDGRPATVDVMSHVANFAMPAPWQRRIAGWYGRLAMRRMPSPGS